MTLTNAQAATFEQWIENHGVRNACPACGKTEGWIRHNTLIAGMEYDIEKNKVSPSTVAFFVLMCNNCKYFMLFAAGPILEADS